MVDRESESRDRLDMINDEIEELNDIVRQSDHIDEKLES